MHAFPNIFQVFLPNKISEAKEAQIGLISVLKSEFLKNLNLNLDTKWIQTGYESYYGDTGVDTENCTYVVIFP